MKATFVLTPAEARRLIAKTVIQMPEFQKAWKEAYVLLAGGTTNAFIAQELLGDKTIEPGLCTVGNSTDGMLCVTEPSSRKSFPNVFYKGQPVDKKIDEALQDYHADTVIIKGANAFDQDGHVGIITSGFNGGTVPNFIGYMTSKGLKWICPVGYEKMVPSVPAASRALGGANHIDISMGADPGLYCLSSADIVTEVEAIKMMFNCEAKVVSPAASAETRALTTGPWTARRRTSRLWWTIWRRRSRASLRSRGTRATAPTAGTPAAATTACSPTSCLTG